MRTHRVIEVASLFSSVAEIRVVEVIVAFVVMRHPDVKLDGIAGTMTDWCSVPVGSADVQPHVARMISNGWLARTDIGDAYRLTPSGEGTALAAIRALVGVINEGEPRFEFGLLWSLFTARSSNAPHKA